MHQAAVVRTMHWLLRHAPALVPTLILLPLLRLARRAPRWAQWGQARQRAPQAAAAKAAPRLPRMVTVLISTLTPTLLPLLRRSLCPWATLRDALSGRCTTAL